MADARRAVSRFDGRHGGLARLDAVNEVLAVSPAASERFLARPDGLFQQILVACLELAAVDVDEDPPVVADEFQTARRITRAHQSDPVGIERLEFILEEGVVGTVGVVGARGLDLDRAGVVGLVAELADINDMRAAVGHFAPAGVHDEAPVEVAAPRVVGPPHCVALPHLPVERFGNRFLLKGREESPDFVVVRVVVGHVDLDGVKFSQAPVAHQFAGLAHRAGRAFVRAGLEDAAIAFHRLAHGSPLGDRVGQRFFAIDILAGPRRRDRDEGMPVIGSADQRRINILACQQFAEVGVQIAPLELARLRPVLIGLFHFLERGLQTMRTPIVVPPIGPLFHIAQCHHLHVGHAEELLHVPGSLPAQADAPHCDAVARRGAALRPQGRSRNDRGKPHCRRGHRRGTFEKLTPVHLLHLLHLSTTRFY